MAFSDIKTRVTQIVGAGGSNYTAKLNAAVNFAQREVCIVNWEFLYKEFSFSTSADLTIYDLWDNDISYNDFGKLAGEIVWLNDGTTDYKLLKASETDISLNPLSATGRPRYYAISAMTVDTTYSTKCPAIKIGYPTADSSSYTITVPYFKVLADLSADADVSDISYVYNDDPIVAFAVAKMWEMLEDPQKQQGALQDAYAQMNQMLSKVPYRGPSYFEIKNSPRPQKDEN